MKWLYRAEDGALRLQKSITISMAGRLVSMIPCWLYLGFLSALILVPLKLRTFLYILSGKICVSQRRRCMGVGCTMPHSAKIGNRSSLMVNLELM